MNCEYCLEEFVDSMDGLIVKTFHELVHHTTSQINKDNSVDWECNSLKDQMIGRTAFLRSLTTGYSKEVLEAGK